MRPRKLSQEQFIARARAVHGDKYSYHEADYEKSTLPVKIWCEKHKCFFLQRANTHLNGSGCPLCGKERSNGCRDRLTTEEFVQRAREVHGDKYCYDEVVYVNNKTRVKIWCKKHQEFFMQFPHHHLSGVGCKKCGTDRIRLSKEEFLTRATDAHGDAYDYSYVNYTNQYIKVKIWCKKCGAFFFQTPNNHLAGHGCSRCVNREPLSREEFIQRSQEIHGEKYDYSKVVFVNTIERVEIYCKKHGNTFTQRAGHHLRGMGCPICAKTAKLNVETFVERARALHGDRFNYDSVSYVNGKTPVKIWCNKHDGYFEQTPHRHLAGKFCPVCLKLKLERQGYRKPKGG